MEHHKDTYHSTRTAKFNTLHPLLLLPDILISKFLCSVTMSGNRDCDWMHHVLGGQIKIMTIHTPWLTEDHNDFINIYRSLGRLSSLQKISHTWGYGPVRSPWDPTMQYVINVDAEIVSIIYPISMLIHLECLELSPWYPFTEHNISALAQCAATFPTLKELSISSSALAGRPTFNSLCVLASNCSELTSLTISLDAKTIPSNVIPTSCRLQHLHIDAEWENTPSVATIAVFLDTLFPYLRSVCCSESLTDHWYDEGDPRKSEVQGIILTICQPAPKAEKERLRRFK